MKIMKDNEIALVKEILKKLGENMDKLSISILGEISGL